MAQEPPATHYSTLEGWLGKLTTGTPLLEAEVKLLVAKAREVLIKESNVQVRGDEERSERAPILPVDSVEAGLLGTNTPIHSTPSSNMARFTRRSPPSPSLALLLYVGTCTANGTT